MAAVNRSVSILDFGGGTGITYLHVLDTLPADVMIDYHVVEVPRVCETGRKLYSHDERIQFHKELPSNHSAFDIVHVGSALQYIEDWRDLLTQLTEYGAFHLLLTGLTSGDFPSYVTAQTYYESQIPVMFFNTGDVIECLDQLNYRSLFQSNHIQNIRGVEQELPQPNFPPQLRIGHTKTLLFQNIARRDTTTDAQHS